MHIKRIHEMIERLTECALSELKCGEENVCTEEFGVVADMIKDLAEAEYKARISKAMEETDLEGDAEDEYSRRYYDDYRLANGRFAKKGVRGAKYMPRRGYEEPEYYLMADVRYEYEPEYWRDMDKSKGKMYYTESEMKGARDKNSGKSSMSRAEYVRTKREHTGASEKDKTARVNKLEEYKDDINEDLKELINDMMPEEKTILKQKLTKLGTLI